MKKTFPLSLPGKDPQRVRENIKQDVRKYLKRERNKKRPEGVDYWDFDCKSGQDREKPVARHVEELMAAIDQAASTGAGSLYLEILAKPGVRRKSRPQSKGIPAGKDPHP